MINFDHIVDTYKVSHCPDTDTQNDEGALMLVVVS